MATKKKIQKMVIGPCKYCGKTAVLASHICPLTCEKCAGTGEIIFRSMEGKPLRYEVIGRRTCEVCGGSGKAQPVRQVEQEQTTAWKSERPI